MDIHVFQHVSFEGPGYIQKWADKNNHRLVICPLYENAPLPAIHEISALILLGGPMSVTEEDKYSWLKPEKQLIKELMPKKIPVLGLCLGAQLIANALGASIRRNEYKEIGWLPVKRTETGRDNPYFKAIPDNVMAFHWHGETFDLPQNADNLMFSIATKHQAFQIGRALGLQFHFEATRESVELLTTHCTDDLTNGRFIQTKNDILAVPGSHIKELNGYMEQILDKWIRG